MEYTATEPPSCEELACGVQRLHALRGMEVQGLWCCSRYAPWNQGLRLTLGVAHEFAVVVSGNGKGILPDYL